MSIGLKGGDSVSAFTSRMSVFGEQGWRCRSARRNGFPAFYQFRPRS